MLDCYRIDFERTEYEVTSVETIDV